MPLSLCIPWSTLQCTSWPFLVHCRTLWGWTTNMLWNHVVPWCSISVRKGNQLQQWENCPKNKFNMSDILQCTLVLFTNSFKSIFPDLTNTGRETWSSMTVYSCTLSTTTTCIFLPVSSSTASPPVPILPTVSHLCLTFTVDPTRWQLKTAQSQNILWPIGQLAHWALGKPNKCSKYLLAV